MEFHFSERMLTLKPSVIREILKSVTPDMIAFAAGNPSTETFPIDEMGEIANSLFADKSRIAGILQYGVSEGYQPLRELCFSRMRGKYQTGGDQDELIITSGGQQAIDLLTKAMVDPGDTVIVEGPSFIGSLNTFRTYQANLVAVPMQSDGMDLDALEHCLKTEKNVKFIYIISTFQNPSGYTTSLEKRRAILALAQKYDVLILEDNPYFELRYEGEYVPNIKSLDTEGRVVFAGSYSKILSAGIRLGYAIGHRDLIAKLVIGKQATDVHTNLFFQVVAAEYMSRYDLDAHIEKARGIYREKRDLMLRCLEQKLPQDVTFSRPQGGLFVWMELPEGSDGKALAALTVEQKVSIVPGNCFMVDDEKVNRGVRLNYSMPSKEQIERGTDILAECVRQYLGK
ncbi:MAG TPA: PLP-dependent aminotransferase family protein [Candidatus Ventrousia excrementavium]|uniref:PLP-dependent aminotransferase family protein n=1 Tax=Candidatus Ventrousia excrementavium TaxID=2840961 RepID=A0A9D1IWW9_9CLOT|nr:PLP-dependent aminotransferase family protein [Candidatus Ventrousia excrementavium]